ncbi:unnamed protein product [Haemonchus placei]|uniref:Dirigent protein n=1 Tax=Haemonchus placei TaxID=6290 RepID=A0A0N4WVZ9_HAEPC|nr:unnamed protein product [Haemonchus placei]
MRHCPGKLYGDIWVPTGMTEFTPFFMGIAGMCPWHQCMKGRQFILGAFYVVSYDDEKFQYVDITTQIGRFEGQT